MAPISERPKNWYEKFWLISLISLSLGVSLISLSYLVAALGSEGGWKIASITLKEAGFASLITFFLNISVEWINRRRHVEETELLAQSVDNSHKARLDELLKKLDENYQTTSQQLLKDVFQTVYQRNIHEGIFKVIDEHILKRDHMRRNYKCSVTISSPQDLAAEGYVEAKFQVRYDAVNLTKKDIDIPVAFASIDITPRHERHCRFISLRVGTKVWEGEALEQLVKKNVAKSQLSFKMSEVIKANSALSIYFEYEKVAPNNNSDVICSTVPMDSLECDVLLKDDSLSVAAESLHPESERECSAPNRPEYVCWRIDHAILPGQGVVIYWHPKIAAVVDAANDDSESSPLPISDTNATRVG